VLVGYSYVLGIIDGSPAVLWASPWTWQAQLTWIGKILGLDTKAAQLLTTIRSQADDLKNQNAKLNRKSLQAMTVTDGGVNQVLDPSNTASYLEGLRLRYNDALGCNRHRRHPSAGADQSDQSDQSDRHRRASGAPHRQDAGGDGFAGLPHRSATTRA
jgi:hypothetical protein